MVDRLMLSIFLVDPAEDDVSLVDADVSVPEKAEDAEKLEKTLEEAKAQIVS